VQCAGAVQKLGEPSRNAVCEEPRCRGEQCSERVCSVQVVEYVNRNENQCSRNVGNEMKWNVKSPTTQVQMCGEEPREPECAVVQVWWCAGGGVKAGRVVKLR